MATTSPDGLISPDASDPYDLTSDMAAMQASTQAALVNRASRTGTNSQMLNATGVQTGTLWYNTSESRLYRYNGTGWDGVSDLTTTTAVSTVGSPASGVTASIQRATIRGGWCFLLLDLSATSGGFGPTTSVTSIFTLNSAYRPVDSVYTGGMVTTSGVGYGGCAVRITTSGAVSIAGQPSNSTNRMFVGVTYPI